MHGGCFHTCLGNYDYIGLDECCNTFFKYHNNFEYVNGSFPDVAPKGDIFIAIMSLGFNRRFHLNKDNKDFIDNLRKAFQNYKMGLTHVADWVQEILEVDFAKTVIKDGSDILYFWKKKED